MARIYLAFALVSMCVQAQDAGERYYNAVRNNDLPALRELVKTLDVNNKDRRETTPLMYSAAVGSREAMRILLDAGADAKASNALKATALHWCAGDYDKVRMLVEKGADVNAIGKAGRSPLTLAAVQGGNVKTVEYLIARGANVKGTGSPIDTPLVAAAEAGDHDVLKVLLDKGAEVHALGDMALIRAAGMGSAPIVKLLLAKGANANAVTPPDLFPKVKNGPILLGKFTPLLLAATFGPPELVRSLLEAGANVNAQDVRGMTPLMYAVSTDRPSPEIIRMLIDKGTDLSLRMQTGETVADWVKRYNDPRVLSLFGLSQQPVASMLPAAAENVPTAREAVIRSLSLLQKTSVGFFQEGGCVACHAQPMAAMAVSAARANHIPVDEPAAAADLKSARLQWSSMEQRLLQKLSAPGDPDASEYAMSLFDALNAPGDRTTDAMIVNLLAMQQSSGSWAAVGFARPPIEQSAVTNTAMAIKVISRYGMPGRKADTDAAIRRATAWLQEAELTCTEDRIQQILGLLWGGKSNADVQKRVRALIAQQRADGGWSQTPYLGSDAYATGEAVYTLLQAGMKPTDKAVRNGVAFLLKTQKPDGSWHVVSRSPKFQPYFQSGFPYDHDQWISMAATAWSAMALAYAAPEEKPLRAAR